MTRRRIAAGAIAVLLLAAGVGFLIDSSRDPAEVPAVKVARPERARPVDDDRRDAPAPRRALLGEVLSADGAPIAGATVRATLEGGAIETSISDGEGGFFLDGLERPVREVRFSAPGHDDVVVTRGELPDVPEAFWSQRLKRAAGAPLSPHADDPTQTWTRVEGVVVDRRGQPVESYRVLASRVDPTGRRRRPTFTAVDDAEGRFAVDVRAGRVSLSIIAEGYRPAEAVEVDVDEGEVEQVRVVLDESVAVRGRVVDATTGQPVAGARVAMLYRGLEPAFTDGDGRFTFQSVPEENANLVVSAEGYLDLNAGGIDGRRSRDQSIELRLSPSREGVRGEVVGIGVTVSGSDEGVVIQAVLPGSPGVGILEAGDVIVEVDGVALGGRALRDSMGAIRGEEGTTLRLVVKGKDGARRDVSLERTRVAMPEG